MEEEEEDIEPQIVLETKTILPKEDLLKSIVTEIVEHEAIGTSYWT